MNKQKTNFIIDSGLFISGIIVITTGTIKLFNLSRNHILSELHDIVGLLFIIFIIIHMVLHFKQYYFVAKSFLEKD